MSESVPGPADTTVVQLASRTGGLDHFSNR
ncbi:hypothetical protein EDD90_3037 [Streptomyces sp. Ag109_O5-1]|nr:hypothetical protein EDD90_3037 [Streptomyces sp. Ag109_O5-1]